MLNYNSKNLSEINKGVKVFQRLQNKFNIPICIDREGVI